MALPGLRAVAPRAGIIVNLLLLGDHYDVALRDLGLLLAAVTLARLAAAERRDRSAAPATLDRAELAI